MSLAAPELGGHVEYGRGLRFLPRQSANHLSPQGGQRLGQVGAFEELLRILVIRRSAAVSHLVKVDGKFCGVERFPFA